MTVSYSAKTATASFSCFFKLLMRWRGSIYRILWKEFMIFACAYFALSFIYRFALADSPDYRRYFEMTAEYCSQFGGLIPVAFVLGFYVNYVASRWWEKFQTIPWPGSCAMLVTANLHGHDERARLMRRTVMRYICLSFVMTMASISPPVKKRFPTWQHMVEAGFMLPNEEKILENIKTQYNKYFIPLIWAAALINRARKEGRIKDDFAVKTIIDEINQFRSRLFKLFNFDWVTIPLVYTQVVTLAVYTFFVSCLMGRQFLDNGRGGDMYFPFFTFLQFLFYMGWLKVAETMLNPFGEDDDDFEINHIIDRNLKISYLVVDEMHAEHPELIKDQYWDTNQFELPYTTAAEPFKTDPHIGSAANIEIPQSQQQFVNKLPSLLSLNEEFDTRDENLAFRSAASFSRRGTFAVPRRPSQVSWTGSKASLRFGGFIRSIKHSVRKGSVGTELLEAELERAVERSNAKSRKRLQNNESFTSNDMGDAARSHNEYHDEIFTMSDSDSDDNDHSTFGLVQDGAGSNLREKLRHRNPNPRIHRRSSEVPLVNGSATVKLPVRRVHSGGTPASPADPDPEQHSGSGHHRPPRCNDDATTADIVTSAHPLDTIREDATSCPTSPVASCHFVVGTPSPQALVGENPLVASIRQQLARDLREKDVNGLGGPSETDVCEMKILDLLGRSEPRYNNNEMVINTNGGQTTGETFR